MPSTDIIGYLWSKRHAFDIQAPSEAVRLAADLLDGGLDCIHVEDQLTLGIVSGVTTEYPRKAPEEWDDLVHKTIVDAAVADTIHMMSEKEDDAV